MYDPRTSRVRESLTTGAGWELEVCDRLAGLWFDNLLFGRAVEMYQFILTNWPDDALNPYRQERISEGLMRQR